MKAKRVIVISDLHLGGEASPMMSCPEILAEFLRGLAGHCESDEELELVIAGDFVDFLAVAPYSAWTPEPELACEKLQKVMESQHFGPIFEALREHVQKHPLHILLGNHDVELALPPVQEAFERFIGGQRNVRWICDGRALRMGRLLIEHGNRYDYANRNDWETLRAIASAQSRGEDHSWMKLAPSAGSLIVEKVVNPLRGLYPFLDLLQVSEVTAAFLLHEFEPSLKWHLPKITAVLRGAWSRAFGNLRHKESAQPSRISDVAGRLEQDDWEDGYQVPVSGLGFRYEFSEEETNTWKTGDSNVSHDDWNIRFGEGGIRSLVDLGKPIPLKRLKKIQRHLRKRIPEWRESIALGGPTGSLGKAAKRMCQHAGVEVVVMGHSHQARHIGPAEKATYINTGTWGDLIRIPEDCLQEDLDALREGETAKFETFLRHLCLDQGVRHVQPSWADIRVEPDGAISHAKLVQGERVTVPSKSSGF